MREFRGLTGLPSRASRILAIGSRFGRDSGDLAIERGLYVLKPKQETLSRSEIGRATPENMRVVVPSATLGAQSGIN